jgi:predicted transglutaminase-like cysteine proteinase
VAVPDETLKLRSGDCEDRALLIASMLLASGISSFNVRVALGKFRAWMGEEHDDFGHVWVMYKDESGR